MSRVLVHTVPAVLVLAAGLPLVLQWGLDEHGDARGDWFPLAPILLITLARVLLHLVRAPRPRLDQDVDRGAMQRWLVFASVSRGLPESPRTRITAGAFACEQVEAAVLVVAGVAGLIATALIRSSPWWAGVGALVLVIAMVPVVRACRGWIYLRLLHTADRAG